MQYFPAALQDLADQFARLPGIGGKTAQRLAFYVLGLPERPVERLRLENCDFAFAPDAEPMQPAMADGVEPCLRRGVIARNVGRIELADVSMQDVEGPGVEAENVGKIVEDGVAVYICE